MKRTAFVLLAFLLAGKYASAQTHVTFYTTKGIFTVALYDSLTPITSGNFISLVNSKFYDGVIFHRVINNFMIQGGDPTGTGQGGPGYSIQDEFDSSLSNVQKTISMANSGPNTGGSQFFINLVNNTYLDFDKPPYTSAHPVFGIVVSGFSVVQAIGKVPVNSTNRPVTPVVMDSLRVTPAGQTGTRPVPSPAAGIDIYPQPFHEEGVITVHSGTSAGMRVTVIDQSGKIIFSTEKHAAEGKIIIRAEEISGGALPAGLYYVIASDGNLLASGKFLIAR